MGSNATSEKVGKLIGLLLLLAAAVWFFSTVITPATTVFFTKKVNLSCSGTETTKYVDAEK